MNKREISEHIAKKLEIKKFEAYQFIDFLIEVMADSLDDGKKIVISNFGTFKVVQRNEKRVINPNDQEAMIIPAKKILKFLPSKNLKQTLESL